MAGPGAFTERESLALLDAYVRIPTVSSQVTAATVERVVDFWRPLGLAFKPLWGSEPGTGGIRNPALFAEVAADTSGAPTLLLYGHWDVQPPGAPEQWVWEGTPCAPFEPTYFLDGSAARGLAELPTGALDRVALVARGAADNKGQHLANVLGVLRAKAAGGLRWNVKVLLDGEEEVGSPNLTAIVAAHREQLGATLLVGSDGPKSDNRPTLLLGTRGLLALRVRCENGSGRLLHSGNYGNVVPNPTLPLTRLLDAMADRVAELAQATAPFRERVLATFGPRQSAEERAAYEPFLRPTFNVNSLLTDGATTGQRRTVIPDWIEASIDVRLVPGLVPQVVYEALAALVQETRVAGLTFSIQRGSANAASYTAPEREGFRWLTRTAERFWGEPLRIVPLLGGTLPNAVFTDALGLAAYWLPGANSNNRQHDANEHLVLEHFFRQQDLFATLVSAPFEE